MAVTTENTYVGDGSTVLYSFTFPYIEVRDVYVSLDGVDQTLQTEYTFANATTIEFATAPADGVEIRIYRQTDVESIKAVFYPGSAIRARDLNDNFTQNLYVTQEAIFSSDSATEDAAAARGSAEQAAQSASEAAADAAQAGADASEALTKATQAQSDASTALNTSQAAESTANGAETKADAALNAVLEVVPFDIVPSVADIPADPEDQDRVKVTDATGIESFSPLTGLPGGFVGDSGISVEIAWSENDATWGYLSYNPIDPDDRYEGALNAFPNTGGTITGDTDITADLAVTGDTSVVDLDVTGDLVSYGNPTRGSGEILLNCEDNSHAVTIKGPAHSAGATYTLTLPDNTGATGQVLATDGNGKTSWTTVVTDIDLDSYPALP